MPIFLLYIRRINDALPVWILKPGSAEINHPPDLDGRVDPADCRHFGTEPRRFTGFAFGKNHFGLATIVTGLV